MSKQIDWAVFDDAFSSHYSHPGKPAKHIRLMVGLSILKHMENLSDEALVQRWVQNPYYQAFTGELEFQWKPPCDPTSLTKFRNRVGSAGHEKILSVSIAMHQERIMEDEMCIDTTVLEKNTTFPADAKQYRKIHDQLLKIARAVARKRFRRRAAIEPVIGHLKSDHRLKRNFLKGFVGDQINLLMAAAAFNFKKWMRLLIFWLKKLNSLNFSKIERKIIFFISTPTGI